MSWSRKARDVHGRSQDFSKGGGHTDSYRGYSSDCHLNIVSCLLTRRLTKGGSRAPQDPPWLRLWMFNKSVVFECQTSRFTESTTGFQTNTSFISLFDNLLYRVPVFYLQRLHWLR